MPKISIFCIIFESFLKMDNTNQNNDGLPQSPISQGEQSPTNQFDPVSGQDLEVVEAVVSVSIEASDQGEPIAGTSSGITNQNRVHPVPSQRMLSVRADLFAQSPDEDFEEDIRQLGEALLGGDLVFQPPPGPDEIQARQDADEQIAGELELIRAIARRDELEDKENRHPNVVYNNNNVETEDGVMIIQLNPDDFEPVEPAPGPVNPPGNNRRRPRSPGSPSPYPTRRFRW